MTRTGRFGVGRTAWLLSLLWLSLTAAAQPAGATTLRRLDLTEIVQAADRVVHARVVGNRVQWDRTGSRIVTQTEFAVIDDVKGSGPDRLIISQLGGRIDPIEMVVAGTPSFIAGEEVVLFTEPEAGGGRQIVGLSQGVARVRTDPRTGEAIATAETPGGVSFVGGNAPRGAAPLAVLLDQVRRLAATGPHTPQQLDAPATDLPRPPGDTP